MNLAEHLFLEALMSPTGDTNSPIAEQAVWKKDALCREFPDVTWFPGRGEPTGVAKAVCARCVVREECLEYTSSLDPAEAGHGIWGGTSPKQRRELRRPCAGNDVAA